MKPKHILAVALAAATLELAQAHHSLVANYRLDQTVVIEGTVVEFLYRSPHSFLRVSVQNQIRPIEWLGANQLGRAGVNADTLRTGDHVIVTGNPSRNSAELMLRLVRIERPADGWQWDMGGN